MLDLNGGAHLKRYPDVMGHVMRLAEPVSFAGKQAIVTGAGSGIGAALCRALAAAGADVLCTDVDGDAAERDRRRGLAPDRPGSTSPTPLRSRPRSTTSSPAPGGST